MLWSQRIDSHYLIIMLLSPMSCCIFCSCLSYFSQTYRWHCRKVCPCSCPRRRWSHVGLSPPLHWSGSGLCPVLAVSPPPLPYTPWPPRLSPLGPAPPTPHEGSVASPVFDETLSAWKFEPKTPKVNNILCYISR